MQLAVDALAGADAPPAADLQRSTDVESETEGRGGIVANP
jgi:hypothetical protein